VSRMSAAGEEIPPPAIAEYAETSITPHEA